MTVCEFCGKRVLQKEPAWVSHRHGFTVHLDCAEFGWYRRLLEAKTA